MIINGEKVNANWSDLKAPHKFKAEHVFSDTSSSDNGDNIVISEKMSSTSRYVHSQHLETVTVNVSMGDVNVYLDSAKPAGDEVVANINMSMGDIIFIFQPLGELIINLNINLVILLLRVINQQKGQH